jgi:endonuclease/exonuclease/phosphatase family metal-dependent hydrolase
MTDKAINQAKASTAEQTSATPAHEPGTAPATLSIASHNIHKGLSHFNRRVILDELRQNLHSLEPDLVFLQEVQGLRQRPLRRNHAPPVVQHEFLSGGVYSDVVYGQNATYDQGHHGNAVLSRHPVLGWENIDISHHALESRGMLHARIQIPGWPVLHAVCVHLGLFAQSRRYQLGLIADRISEHVPDDEPLILAGDFNDWRGQLSNTLERELGIGEAFELLHGEPARTFPAGMPVLPLDRVYLRGLQVRKADVLGEGSWAKLSDHAALYVEVTRG